MKSGFRKIDTFLAVVETGSFEGAAKKLFITSSAVSLRISTLESEMGTLLLLRRRPCVLTPQGHIFYRHANQLHQVKQLMENELASCCKKDS
ncbi:LysR family transcriptional regulator [Serratia sp. AKBS12]|uniref:LysR family transcriptional regulator n=1 Tax=Serratia sp. AKBS12 TaxID=2974597 RepID=UPI002166BB21|nr:LysR family transcriptional regulator [Serratia sp. AKBS12]MCS3408336.1 LysR family transcriptional regulator [Serratia sp. AKBS12]